MAYRRRYWESEIFVTTPVIGEGAVTGAKIADGTITTVDIKDRTIQSVDIAPGAIQLEHLAPDIPTIGIADASITEPKLANQAVSTAKLDDGAVVSGKIGTGAVTEPKIGTAAVTINKIKDGNVTPPKLAAIDTPADGEAAMYNAASGMFEWKPAVGITKHINLTDKEVAGVIDHANASVTTIKIKDRNVTAPKIHIDAARNLIKERLLVSDDFDGAALHPRWAESGNPGGAVTMVPNSLARIETGDAIMDTYRINFNGVKSIPIAQLPILSFGGASIPSAGIKMEFGLIIDATHYVIFRFLDEVNNNWWAITRDGGAEQAVDAGVLEDGTFHLFDIKYLSGGRVEFYIDGLAKASITVDVPVTGDAEPQIEIQSRSGGIRVALVDLLAYQVTRQY